MKEKNISIFFLYVLDPRWINVQNLLHFGWNFKHKPPKATDSPHPFKKRTQRACTILMWWILLFNMMCGVTFSKYLYIKWEDGIQCQKSNLTKFSPVRFLKFGQIQFLTLDSISPVKTLGKIHPRSTTFKLAQKICRKRPAAQISKSVHKECVQLYHDNFFFFFNCMGNFYSYSVSC